MEEDKNFIKWLLNNNSIVESVTNVSASWIAGYLKEPEDSMGKESYLEVIYWYLEGYEKFADMNREVECLWLNSRIEKLRKIYHKDKGEGNYLTVIK
ncbi:MAG TPA: hypothetical protein GX707_19290 [Epulopiscium sp.]|nr:hypothetical protein [Candidatus Epulonipiscium sp.]